MRDWLLDHLVAPGTTEPLALDEATRDGDEIVGGVLVAARSGRRYPIVRGIPRFAGDSYARSFGLEWHRHRTTQFDTPERRHSRERFFGETGFSANGLRGALVLDAGCGAGRFLGIVSECGARVIGVDLSSAVDVAAGNHASDPNVGVVQASITGLPFRPGTFDYVYCLGVLQHTPAPLDTLRCLADMPRPGGELGLWWYKKYWWTYLDQKYLLRPLFRWWPDETLYRFVRAYVPWLLPVSRALTRVPWCGPPLNLAGRILPCANRDDIPGLSRREAVEWSILDTFDQYAPRYDRPQSWRAVQTVLNDAGYTFLRTRRRGMHATRRMTDTAERRRILIVIPNLLFGGAERVAALLSRTLAGEVYLALFNRAGRVEYDVEGTLLDLELPPSTTTRERISNLVRGAVKLARLKRTLGITTTVSFLDAPTVLNALTGGRDSRVVSARSIMSRTHGARGLGSRLYRTCLRWSFSRADLVVANSAGVARDLQLNFGVPNERIQVIPNPCDVHAIAELAAQPIPEPHAIFFDRPVVITMGRLTADKAHWALMRGYAAAREVLPRLRLMIIGEGELRDEVLSLARDLGLRTVVSSEPDSHGLRFADVWCLGSQRNPFAYMARSTAFVLSSVREGFPNALVEALACGLPSVATDCDAGPREILAPSAVAAHRCRGIERAQYGILVPVPDLEVPARGARLSDAERHLASAIVSLCDGSPLHDEYARAARSRATDFRIDRVIPRWELALAEVAGRRPV
jgi:glycosyltransferase involved in cell wall biosynthesis/SAM-dependent methyltransferase